MSEPPPIRILAFARYAELLGADRLELALPNPPTVQGVLDDVRRLPGGDQLPDRILVALNARQAQLGDSVTAGDELALLPPMAGG
ncbi:MAG: MoaD/ThiS family protein [Gemmatimonadales bacterium]